MKRSPLSAQLYQEVRACLHLAIPLAAAQLSQAATNFFDTVMMGLLGSQILAAGALGAISFTTLILIGTGIVSAVGALAATAFGAENLQRVRQIASQGLWLSAIFSIPIVLLLWNLGALLQHLGQEPDTARLAQTYLRPIAWGYPAAIGFAVLKNIISALNRPRLVMVIMVGGVLLNVTANYVLMFGKLGFPALGLAGIGWASTLTFWAKFLAIAGFVQFNPDWTSYRIFSGWYRCDRKILWELVQLGSPIGILFAVESGLFAATAYLMGYLGTVTLAAHQIAIQTAAITFMVPVGISYATTMRVGQMQGRNDPDGARRAGYVGIALGAAFMGAMAILIWSFPAGIVAIYLDTSNPENAPVVELAISLLGVAAIFQLFDGIQVTAAGALRGLKDTRVPMWIGFFSYWGIGMGSGYLLGLHFGWGGVGLWLGLAFGLATAAGTLTWRFHRLI
jgi:MATE family multidrug resistance protein